MTTSIEEVPIDTSEAAVPDGDAAAGPPPEESEAPPPAPKKRGRPAGSLNKKTKAKQEPVPKEEPPIEQATVAPKKRAAPKRPRTKVRAPTPESDSPDSVYPQPPDTRAIAAEVIAMLSNRHLERAEAKRQKYRSWFQ